MFNIKIKVNNFMSIIVTHECNKKCPFCIDKNRGTKEYITIQNIINALKYAKKKKIKDILLIGGEPTLHKDIVLIAKTIKLFGFNLILTTNYTMPNIIKSLDGIVDSFNISFYNQDNLPNQKDYRSDITLSALIYKGQLDTKENLDNFIDDYKDKFILKFSTLTDCNLWTNSHKDIEYLDKLDCEEIILFNEIIGQIYRGHIIKRHDKIINKSAKQSLKCHANGEIKTIW